MRIDNLPATDAAGYAGLKDRVDLHTWQLLKGVVLSTLLGIGTEVSIGDDRSDLVRAIREARKLDGQLRETREQARRTALADLAKAEAEAILRCEEVTKVDPTGTQCSGSEHLRCESEATRVRTHWS